MRTTRVSRPWRPQDDAYLQANWLTPLPVQAKRLRRTVDQVQERRQRLLGAVAFEMIDAPRKDSTPAAVARGRELCDWLNRQR